MIFRFDDISINSDMDEVNAMTEFLKSKGCTVMWAVSVIVSSEAEKGRVFPKIWSAYSTHKAAYQCDKMGIPDLSGADIIASHGLIHSDHRLMSSSAQELSILLSCSLLKTIVFVPPFNKWNTDTELVCERNGIQLVQFEEGWLSAEHEDFDSTHDKYYLHPYSFGLEQLKAWIG